MKKGISNGTGKETISDEASEIVSVSVPSPSINTIQSAGAVEYTDCISAESKTPPSPMSVLDKTLNNLMMRLQ